MFYPARFLGFPLGPCSHPALHSCLASVLASWLSASRPSLGPPHSCVHGLPLAAERDLSALVILEPLNASCKMQLPRVVSSAKPHASALPEPMSHSAVPAAAAEIDHSSRPGLGSLLNPGPLGDWGFKIILLQAFCVSSGPKLSQYSGVNRRVSSTSRAPCWVQGVGTFPF